MRTMIGLILLSVLLSACGVGTQSEPERISIANSPTAGGRATTNAGGPEVTVYFVRGNRLHPVRRSVAWADLGTALDVLVMGPNRQEVVDGLRTALSPQEFDVPPPVPGDPTVSIDVPREFTSVAGGNQLLAVAQLVWTVTEFPGIRRVRLTAGGAPLELPTDAGLTDASVSREDFLSVAAPEQSAPPEDPATTAPTSMSPRRAGPRRRRRRAGRGACDPLASSRIRHGRTRGR